MTTDPTLTDATVTDAGVPTDDVLRSAALQRLRRKRDFLQHLVSYVIVNTLFVVVWLVLGLTVGAWFPWPLFPIAGWGIGLAFHAWATFGPPSRPISDDAVFREMQRLSRL